MSTWVYLCFNMTMSKRANTTSGRPFHCERNQLTSFTLVPLGSTREMMKFATLMKDILTYLVVSSVIRSSRFVFHLSITVTIIKVSLRRPLANSCGILLIYNRFVLVLITNMNLIIPPCIINLFI